MRKFLFAEPRVQAAVPPTPTEPRYRFVFDSQRPMTREQVQHFLKFMRNRESMDCIDAFELK